MVARKKKEEEPIHPGKGKAAGYVRVSTAEQTEGTSLDTQKEAIQKEATHKGYELVEIYSDEGISGAKMSRPDLQRMLQDAAQQKFEIIFYTNLSRLSRSTKDVYEIMENLKEADCASYCIENPAISAGGIYGDLMLGVLSSIFQFERAIIRERCTTGIKQYWRNGGIVGELPYGYKKTEQGKPEIDKVQARNVRLIFKLYLTNRLSTKAVGKELKRRRIPPPSFHKQGKDGKPGKVQARGGKWYGPVIAKLLQNPAYKGEALLAQKQGGVAVTFPPIIDTKTWDAVQARIEAQKHKSKRDWRGFEDRFLLDHYLKCGLCGGKIRRRLQDKDGKQRLYYICGKHQQGRKQAALQMIPYCELPTLNADMADHEILTRLFHILVDPSKHADAWFSGLNAKNLTKQQKGLEKDAGILNDKLARLAGLMAGEKNPKLFRSYQDQQKAVLKEAESNQEELERVKAELEMLKNKAGSFAELKKTMGVFKAKGKLFDALHDMPAEAKKRLIESMIRPETENRIIVRYATSDDIGEPIPFKGERDPDPMTRLAALPEPKILKKHRLVLDMQINLNPRQIIEIIKGLRLPAPEIIKTQPLPTRWRGRRVFRRR